MIGLRPYLSESLPKKGIRTKHRAQADSTTHSISVSEWPSSFFPYETPDATRSVKVLPVDSVATPPRMTCFQYLAMSAANGILALAPAVFTAWKDGVSSIFRRM